MSGKKEVLVIGPGFIGWNVVDLLVTEQKYQVTGLVRRSEHANAIRASGAECIIGDLDDHELVANKTAQSDIVFHTATADHLPSVVAVLDGIKQRAKQGLSTIYIHTSGTSILDDGALGNHKSDKIYTDRTPDMVDSVPDNAPHRPIDLAIVEAQKAIGVQAKVAIMIPPLIYGYNPNHQRLTIQIPTMTRFALKHGYAPQVGNGASVESNIHVKDLAKAYIVLLHHMEDSTAESLLENPYYFCECTGDKEPSWHEVAMTIGQGLHEAGQIKDPTPRPVPESLYSDLFGDFTDAVIGLNSRSRADRLKELGWKPTEKDWKRSFLEDELPALLKEDGRNFAGYTGTVHKAS